MYIPSPSSSELQPHPSLPRSFLSNQTLELPSQSGPLSPNSYHSNENDFRMQRGPIGGAKEEIVEAGSVHELELKEKGQGVHTMQRGFNNIPLEGLRWWGKVFPSSTACRLLLFIVILESLVDLSIEGNILWRFNAEVKSTSSTELELENKRRLPIYLIIYGLAHLWQLVLTVIAIRTRNTVQVIAVTAFNFAFLGYAVIQIYELRQILGDNLADTLNSSANSDDSTLLSLPLNVLTAVVIGIVTTGCLALVVLAYFIRREFGWQRYRFLGADLQIRALYFRFQVYECICYFSAFFCAGFGIQFIWLVLQKTDVEYIITWVAFPVSVLLLIMGRFAAKYENRLCMRAFMFGLLAGCAYFIFKLVRIWQQDQTTYVSLTKSLTVFDALSSISLLACLVWGVIVWRGFGKGLKEAVLNQPKTSLSSFGFWRTRSVSTTEPTQNELNIAQRRISID